DIHGDNKIDSDSNNGVAWFSVDADPFRYHYAGIFETTDLGVPLTGKTDAKAIWNGQFESSIGSIKTSTAFELEITFANAGTGMIEAFVERNNQTSPATIFFHLNGKYDALGVITGKVYYGEFSDTTARTQTNAEAAANGVLSGIIGSNGAVGIFTSGTEISPDGVITGGTNINTGYVGGFVASPFAGVVSYRDWVRLASPTPADSPITPSSGNLNQFLTTTGNALNKGTYTGADENYNFGLLEGDLNDGFSIYEFTESLTTNYFVGISSTTSLGAALPYRQMFNGEAEAEWTGRFVIDESVKNVATHEFKLMVDFQNSDISADVAGYSFTDVTFDENGVVSQGIITRAAVSEPFVEEEGRGQLRAIIGQEGAVGVFHSNANSPIIFAGGFVADPTVMEDMTDMPNMPTPESAFKTHYGAKTDNTQLHPDLTTGGTVAFVEIPSAGLDTSSLTFTNTGNFMPLTIKLGVDPAKADVVDGFVIMGARSSSVNFYRAGLLSTTDLGAALDNAVTANWTGTAYSSVHVDSANNNVPLSIPLTLTVDFDAGTIKTAGAISYGNAGDMIEIKGLFKGGTKDNGLPVGILGGTVDYDYNRFFSSNDIPLIGLIGADGAIGVFAGPAVGSNVGVVVGGFQATPNE
ncbi:MAG: hypothetical protein K8953_07135, partial [Proteobacteria bacterium]|nr:hypothetical protein [Pseudomonadota bacterium]